MTKSHDIVDRLRLFGSSAFEREAANEIERLRTQLEMWQDGNIMSESHHDEIKRLRAERDEARRSCCEYAAIVDGADTADGMESGRFYEIAMKYMKDRGWDCFKEPAHAS